MVRHFVVFFDKKNPLRGPRFFISHAPLLKNYSTEPTSRDWATEGRGLKILVNAGFDILDLLIIKHKFQEHIRCIVY